MQVRLAVIESNPTLWTAQTTPRRSGPEGRRCENHSFGRGSEAWQRPSALVAGPSGTLLLNVGSDPAHRRKQGLRRSLQERTATGCGGIHRPAGSLRRVEGERAVVTAEERPSDAGAGTRLRIDVHTRTIAGRQHWVLASGLH